MKSNAFDFETASSVMERNEGTGTVTVTLASWVALKQKVAALEDDRLRKWMLERHVAHIAGDPKPDDLDAANLWYGRQDQRLSAIYNDAPIAPQPAPAKPPHKARK